MSNDIIDHYFIAPANGDTLDNIANLFAVVRGSNETDHQLRTRINNLLRHQPGPSKPTLLLFVLLEKLGLKSGSEFLDTFLPIGYPRR